MIYVAVFSMLALVVLMLSVTVEMEDVAFAGPKLAAPLALESYCAEDCRVEGSCPLTGTASAAPECPLWGFVEAQGGSRPTG